MFDQARTLVLGPPGTGKTERMLRVVEHALDAGTPPERVAFVTFTKGAAEEARSRACDKFRLSPPDLPHFRTLHSLAFRELGLRRRDVMGEKHLEELADACGEDLGESLGADPDAPAVRMNAHSLLTVDGYARATRRPLRQAWEDHGGNLDWHRLLRFSEALRLYKHERLLLDFTDMLERYAEGGRPVDVDVAVVDEAQDLTALQWAVAGRAFANAQELWAAGDDDQSIHRWAGAAEEYLLNLEWHREILPLSHRLPRAIHAFASQITAKIGHRYAKPFRAAAREGRVEWFARPDEVDLSSGSWLVLARTRYQLGALAALAREQGVFYSTKGASSVKRETERAIRAYEAMRAGSAVEAVEAQVALKAMGHEVDLDDGREWRAADFPALSFAPIWHDALVKVPLDEREYILTCLRRGERLGKVRVRVDTMHGAKGAEAENVLMTTDMTARVQRGYELDPDAEHRVHYVGATRASENLFLVAPQTQYGFPL